MEEKETSKAASSSASEVSQLISRLLLSAPSFKNCAASVVTGPVSVVEAPFYGMPFLLHAIQAESRLQGTGHRTAIILPDDHDPDDLADALRTIEPSLRTTLLEPWDSFFYEDISPSPQVIGRRMSALHKITNGLFDIAIVPTRAFVQKLCDRTIPFTEPIALRPGDDLDQEKLLTQLTKAGYVRRPLVEGCGDLSVRGFIIDIFPSDRRSPVRIELFGDEIEKISTFDISDQRSIASLNEALIFPCREHEPEPSLVEALKDLLKNDGLVLPNRDEMLAALEAGQLPEGIERFVPAAVGNMQDLPQLFPPDTLFVFPEWQFFQYKAEILLEELRQGEKDAIDHKFVPPSKESYLYEILAGAASAAAGQPAGVPNLTKAIGRGHRVLVLTERQDSLEEVQTNRAVQNLNDQLRLDISPVPTFTSNIEALANYIARLQKSGTNIILEARDDGQRRRLAEALFAEKIETDILHPALSRPFIHKGTLERGVQLKECGLAYIGASEIFGAVHRHRVQRSRASRGLSLLSEVKEGDLVVHQNYGIATYEGLEKIEVAGATWECLKLRFADGDLQVRTDSLIDITKYIGSEGAPPTLSSLSSGLWAKRRTKARENARQVAINLMRLYAERSGDLGFSFSPDTEWQKEMEAAFPFDETDDQLAAINDVKRDMESPKPMDRLICGDVGFGKTEIAIRAVFKAVMDGFQVLVLVPTTILAEQHYQTLTERFSPFAVKVEMLSRFRTKGEQTKILERFASGGIDVIVGTHRLLSKDIRHHRLGLLVIDEEQRFGVEAKEKLKLLGKNIDVLSMTATPIPRTLQMAMSGIREMSRIDTAPEDRQPIQTFVSEYNEDVCVNAIRRELARGGQVFFVHNNIRSLAKVTDGLRVRIPEAKITSAHGQMDPSALENIMMDFLDKKIDVLVCTTIVESGIDIPSVNTLIVSDAERLGLSQAYQLRGRVGRSGVRAYAYFFYTRERIGQGKALERLQTLKEHSGLGSGLRIALKDLEIRGAGSLLGAEQHGKIADVGFELYSQMLSQAVAELKNEPPDPPPSVNLTLPLDASIPSSYIREGALRLDVYDRMLKVRTLTQAEDLRQELRDRFGKVPPQTTQLMDMLRVKVLAHARGIKTILWSSGELTISPLEFYDSAEREVALDELKESFAKTPAVRFSYNKAMKQLSLSGTTPENVLSVIGQTLTILDREKDDEV